MKGYFSKTGYLLSTAILCFLAVGAAFAQTPQATPPVAQPQNPPTTQPQNPQNPPGDTRQPLPGEQPASPPANRPTQAPDPQTQPGNQTTNLPGATPSGATTNPNTVVRQTPGQNVGNAGGVAPAELPPDPPPVAPDFQAPMRPLPSAERVGVDIANQLPLTLDQAIEMALQNNNDIDSSKIDVTIAEYGLKGARGVYDPLLSAEHYYESRTTPTASTIGGAVNGSVTQTQIFGTTGLTGFSPRFGGTYDAGFTSSRTNTSNLNATLNPQFPTDFSASYVQPLWRGLRFDLNRRNIEIAKKNLSLTDAQFRQKAIEVIAQVEQAYWNLVFALRNLQVQIDAVKQARTQLESNQRLVAKGVTAPIDIIAATSQITTFEQNVYTAQEDVTRAENTLKTLLLPDRTSDVWMRPITPVSPIDLEPPMVGLEIAIAGALKDRPEIAQLQSNEEINRINERYYRNQTKPQVDLVSSFTANGLAGSLTSASFNPTTGQLRVPEQFIGGVGTSLRNLVGLDYPTYRVGVRVSLPLGNRVAEANLGSELARGTQLQNLRAQTEQVIQAEVRNALQALRSADARLASALASRRSAEQLYDSEQRQFRAGTTTFYLVLQRQTELLVARSRELQAQTDLNKAISEFQRATGSTLRVNNVTVSDAGQLVKRGPRPNVSFRTNFFPKPSQ